MAGKRTQTKQNRAKLSATQIRYQKRAKTIIQPLAEQSVCANLSLEEFLRNTHEDDDQKIIDTYEKFLQQDIKGQKSERKLLALIPQLLKNHRMRISKLRTKIRRESLDCRTFQLKLIVKNANKAKRSKISRKFIEAKWLKNAIIAAGIDEYDASVKTVEVLNKKTGEKATRSFECLSAQERQSIHDQIKEDRNSLAKKKAKGDKVGALRFCREVKAIPLKQPGKTFRFDDKSNVLIPKVGWLAVRGIDQIRGKDIANATLVKVGSNYYLHVTIYQERKVNEKYNKSNTVIAVDMGVSDEITCSEGTTANLRFEYTKTYSELQRKLSRQQRGSRGWWKTVEKIADECSKTVNARDDAANKMFAYLSMNETIISQDDPISSWTNKKSLAHGSKKVPLGILGRLKEKFKEANHVVLLEQFEATTKTCPYCGNKDDVELSQQEEEVLCSACNKPRPRNVGACWNMEQIAAERGLVLLPNKPIDEVDGFKRASSRCAWSNTGQVIDALATLDELLGHVNDAEQDRAGSPDHGGRKKERQKAKWHSKKVVRGKTDKWAKHSRSYESYVAVEPEVLGPYRKMEHHRGEQEHKDHNLKRHRSHAEKTSKRRRTIDGGASRTKAELERIGLKDLEEEDTNRSCGKDGCSEAIQSTVPAGRGELTLMEMVSDFEKTGLRIESDRRNRQGSQKPLPILRIGRV